MCEGVCLVVFFYTSLNMSESLSTALPLCAGLTSTEKTRSSYKDRLFLLKIPVRVTGVMGFIFGVTEVMGFIFKVTGCQCQCLCWGISF